MKKTSVNGPYRESCRATCGVSQNGRGLQFDYSSIQNRKQTGGGLESPCSCRSKCFGGCV